MTRKNIQFIKVKKEKGEDLIKSLNTNFKKLRIIHPDYQIEYDGNYILFPIKDLTDEQFHELNKTLKNQFSIEIMNKKGTSKRKIDRRTLEDFLENTLPNDVLNIIPRSYDVIGNIAIVEFDRFLELSQKKSIKYKNQVASAIIHVNKGLKSVYEKKSEIKGEYRLREFSILKGPDNPETIHKENKCLFKLDIKTTYFSPRLVYERNRIATSQFNENENITDMFAGVGPFSIQIAKNHPVNIYSFDINPAACKYLEDNVRLNKVNDKITVHNLDVKNLVDTNSTLGETLKNSMDRVIMNLPEKAVNFLDVACFLLKESGGIIHYYLFNEKSSTIEQTIQNLEKKFDEEKYHIVKILSSRKVKGYSPKIDLLSFDLYLRLKK
ncbi:MAG: class I SAM-dependent methyltransferase family protein [Candidatus Lokiarchaeota archaeon]|nr:class I SAM-dependent methyltransferase family protein [Candidatus Lokiarchaeota archaeon]